VNEGCVLTQDRTKPLYIYHRSSPLTRRTLLSRIDGYRGDIELIVWIADKDKEYLILRDASGVRRLKVSGRHVSELIRLPRETLVRIKGYLFKESLLVKEYDIIQTPSNESFVKYLGDIREKDPVELAKYSPWYMRNPLWKDILWLQYYIMKYSREYLEKHGFIELLAPMIGVVSDPGLRGARKLKTRFYGEEYELTSSVIMYKQSSVAVFEKVYFMARNIREEPPENIRTGRHLSEFTQLDIEWAYASIDDAIKLAEGLLEYIGSKLLSKHKDLLDKIHSRFYGFKPPFPRVKYDEALEIVSKLGYEVEWGKELFHEAETALAEYYGSPVWLVGFPVISRGFYYLPDPSDPRYNLDFNLLLPKGYGEVIDGGTREYRYKELVKRIKMLGEPLEKYSWFLDLVKKGGVPPSTGFGLGIERLTRYIAGVKHIVLATAYPKLPGITHTP